MDLEPAIDGAGMIRNERRRQVEVEGWSPGHDDQHTAGELAWAAVHYAAPSDVYFGAGHVDDHGRLRGPLRFWRAWPWTNPPKEHDRLRELVIAGALIAAEIDRLLRADDRQLATHGAGPDKPPVGEPAPTP